MGIVTDYCRILFRSWSVPSGDGKGRTLFQRLFGLNKKDMTSKETKCYNPLNAKIGSTMSFDDMEFRGINFLIESIEAYITTAAGKEFPHTDYCLKGIDQSQDKPLRLRLRVSPNKDNAKGYQLELYRPYDEMKWDEGFYTNVLQAENHEFHIEQDDNGNQLDEPSIYWRVNGAEDPYSAVKTIMKDSNNDGKIEESEMDKEHVSYWDYSRETTNTDTQLSFLEYILVEMDDETKYFTLYRGRQMDAFQLSVI